MRLGVEVGTLALDNPTILASGILGVTPDTMVRVLRSGAAAVVTKSIGSEPRHGHATPTFVSLEAGFLNAMGIPNPGAQDFAPVLKGLKARKGDGKVIVSVFGGGAEEFGKLAKRLAPHADGVELNLSCPHLKGYGVEIGRVPSLVREVVAEVKRSVRCPVWAKLSPNVSDMVEVGRAAAEGGADALVATNTIGAIAISVEARRPVLSHGAGGLSGAPLKPIAMKAVFDLAAELETPIVASGGIATGRDLLEYVMAGASAGEIGSAVVTRGEGVFKLITAELAALLEAEGFENVEAARGAAQRR
ncbi:MAG TPA: dihydroorotate dehydrogenase [Candidatus Thermoplasmatota archaeon]|nr:dihydroorotate dehydrogenase [Candidatus Thermoplasmatota archaeon]